jgi:formiminotetrahydrofolate cyclodeaminase
MSADTPSKTGDLVSLPLRDFVSALGSDAPAPGGGSASAAAGAAGAALLGMAVKLTLGREKYRAAWGELEPVVAVAASSQSRLLELVDEDTRAFDAIVAARKLPKDSDGQKSARKQAIDDATVVATTVPLQTAAIAAGALSRVPLVLEKGNPSCASDAWVAGLLLVAAVEGALANVAINLPGIGDQDLASGFAEDAKDLAQKTGDALAKARALAATRGLLS